VSNEKLYVFDTSSPKKIGITGVLFIFFPIK